jgi:hypothetical protein
MVRLALLPVGQDVSVPMPQPGDRSPGFFVELSRCWAFVYDHNLQGRTHDRTPDGGTASWATNSGGVVLPRPD